MRRNISNSKGNTLYIGNNTLYIGRNTSHAHVFSKAIRIAAVALLTLTCSTATSLKAQAADQKLLTEPMLQNCTDTSVTIQWFSETEGSSNRVVLYEKGSAGMPTRIVNAETIKMSRLRGGETASNLNDASIKQDIYKHVAVIDNLPKNTGKASDKITYKVSTDGIASKKYRLATAPQPGVPMKVLLTSDLQLKDMCAANMQKVYETVGAVDAIWCDGDLVDVTDRVYDWFYADNAFFRVMTGTADDTVGGRKYKGAPLLQSAPIYTAIGNHDVMGVYSETGDLSVQFNSPKPIKAAEELEARSDYSGSKEQFITDNSFNTITYEELFELPESKTGGEKYYATTIGDVRLIVLDTSRVWRLPNLGLSGKYSEWPGLATSDYSYGDFIFEPINEGSDQLAFLKEELSKPEFTNAKYTVVMFHDEAHSLGNNQIPPFTDPVPTMVTDPVTGLPMMTYDYPIDKDYINNLISPLLENKSVDLVFNAHSHIWNRFESKNGVNYLQTSNVGNNYGGFYKEANGQSRTDYPSALKSGDPYSSLRSNWDAKNYVLQGDPYGLEPVKPNVASLPGGKPYLASNTVTAFSILDTGRGVVDSYYFDTTKPDSDVVLFDSFTLK